MPISKKDKILFIHIPKCAGTSIAKTLGIYSHVNTPPNLEILYGIHNNIVLQSLCLEYYNKFIKDNLKQYNIFACVRNPYDRILSDYTWSNRGFKTILEYCKYIKNILLDNKYDKWELMKFNHNHDNHILPQFEYINNTNLNVNIIKFENLNIEFGKLFPKKKLCHVNKKRHSDFLSYFKDKKECIKIINEIYEIDFKTFGYEMIN